MAGERQGRRYPQNLQGVLQLAVDAGSAEEQAPPTLEPMSEERKTWLREALSDICKGQMDEVEQMKRCLELLRVEEPNTQREDEDEEDDREAAFETLTELCDNLDNARDLMTLGGLDLCVSRYLGHEQGGLRWRAAELIASCSQNMPQVQLYLLNIGTLPKLLEMTDSDPNPTVRVKALYAVSSSVVSMGMVQQLVSVLQTPHSPFHEHVLGALCCLVEDCPEGLKDCRDPAVGLDVLLKQRSKELQGKEECEEELDFCERLRTMCFTGQQPEDNGMDR
ncbi:hypothetical protein WMY93_003055 [Mugilogobius chulae]|uniref:Nucleotide exchange factor Fes1 domain-containing protein n=1 Tax=Mugilogobius chulae TaxID=88201 RepID=A0AAW0PYA1_9GOBI